MDEDRTAATEVGAPESMPAADPRADAVRAAVASWTKHLVDLGGRNTLLWYRDLPTGTLDLSTAHPSGLALLMTGRPTKLSDLVREAAAFDDARRRARAIARKARELKEERGIETCFVTFGMATWDLGAGTRAPAAPVLLRACVLRPVSAAHEDYVLDLADHVELNPVLEHYLAKERGLTIDSDGLEALAMAGGGFDPGPAFAGLAEWCLSIPGFAITPRIVVGTFSYAKLPMVADLTAQGELLAGHDVVAALAGDPSGLAAVRVDLPERREDPLFDDQSALLVLDADGSQQDVIEAARSGAHLVVQGPPGTGKSQTIANLVAALAADGKRVLFVAEKRAAIEAVIGRLDRVGLGSLVLDLHDGARAKRRVAAEFVDALDAASAVTGPLQEGAAATETVRRQQDTATELAGHRAALLQKRQPWAVSALQAMEGVSRLADRPTPPRSKARLRGEHLQALTPGSRDAVAEELTRLAQLRAWREDGGEDPWFGAAIATAEEAVGARDRVERLATGGVADLQNTLTAVLADLRLAPAASVAEQGRTLETLASIRGTLETFRPEIFDSPLEEAVVAAAPRAVRAASPVRLGWLERWRIRRAVRRHLRPGAPPADLYAALTAAAGQRAAWRTLAGAGGRPEIPGDLDRARAAQSALAADLAWLGERLPGGRDLLSLGHDDLIAELARLHAHSDRLAVLPSVRGPLDALVAGGWGPLIDDFATRGVDAPDVRAEVEHVWWTSVAEDISLRDPRIGGHSGDHLRDVLERFVDADRVVLKDNAGRVLDAVHERVRDLAGERPDHLALVRAEGGRRRGLKALRDLLPLAPELLTAAKPCWVMSPLVVASVLPPGRWFDVVVFDEASQVPPAEAVSAISRARQVVLAGDSQQLPPTTFFTTAPDEAGGETALLTDGMESILDVLAAALPVGRLRWHYRSLDERLIAFSNAQFYDSSLVAFPGTGVDPVVSLVTVDGVGVVDQEAAAVESTRAEVSRVVELVLEHARTRPEQSLGVITLGLVHATRIEDALRAALADHPEPVLKEFFAEDRPEPFFVKNLERVQGDERDAVILAIGYGKTPHGRVLHRFGPLNIEGGERRLNVAVTRARRSMSVVSALVAEDLDPTRLKAKGAQLLRAFLAYAGSGGPLSAAGGPVADGATRSTTPTPPSRGAAPDGPDADPLLGELARRLRAQGLVVHRDLGVSAGRIDLAVEQVGRPGRLAVAIDTDGSPRAAARARDRDRLRAEQLERLGWRPIRVWSTDIYRDPARDVERIRVAAGGSMAPEEPAGGPAGEPSAEGADGPV